eukprot:6164204-Pyramimonas_sp.AAC.1
MRRTKVFDDLRKVSQDTSTSDDLQAYVSLKFSGLDKSDHAIIVRSAGGKCDKDAFAKALRMQHWGVHE